MRPAPPALLLAAWVLACAVEAPGRAGEQGERADAAAPAVPELDAARAWRHLERLVGIGPRPAGSPALERTRVYIERELERLGLKPVREPFVADTPAGRIAMANVVAELPATAARADAPAPVVVLASHFDTKRLAPELADERFVGANDGGSSTALLLELARVLAGRDERRVAYRLLFLDGEEALRKKWSGDDNTYGSRHHVALARDRRELDRIRAVVLLDMVGDADLRLTTDLNSDRELLMLFFRAARENGLGEHVGGARIPLLDDHLPFLDEGIPSVDLIDFEYGPERRYWHTPEDTLDKCSARSLEIVGRIVLLGLPELERRLTGG